MIKRNLMLGLMAFAVIAVGTAEGMAQDPSARFGQWKMDSTNPPPSINIMTYEAWGDHGMSIKVASTNARGEDSEWGYNTLFDGKPLPVWGQEGSQTAVEFVNDRTTRITNMRDGRVTQVIINTLSEDGNVIENEYVRMDADGKITGVSHATYRRMH
jgi:hypothetical protein